MLIALDYDNTFTADRDLWNAFIGMALRGGHEVKIVTARSHEFDQIHDESLIGIDIIYCDGVAKKDVMDDLGYMVSIWIDDQPSAITQGSQYTFEMLEAWRANGRK